MFFCVLCKDMYYSFMIAYCRYKFNKKEPGASLRPTLYTKKNTIVYNIWFINKKVSRVKMAILTDCHLRVEKRFH